MFASGFQSLHTIRALRAMQLAGHLATLAMLALLAWVGATIFWSLATPATVTPRVAIDTDPARAAQAVVARHLFGETPSRTAAVAKAPPPADIKLHGVIAPMRRGEPAVAVLSIGNNPSISVREGEEAMPGVIVQRVRARAIEIRRDGQVQSLTLPELPPLPASGKPAAAAQTQAQPAPAEDDESTSRRRRRR